MKGPELPAKDAADLEKALKAQKKALRDAGLGERLAELEETSLGGDGSSPSINSTMFSAEPRTNDTSPSLGREELGAAAERIVRDWKGAPPVHVVGTASELAPEILKEADRQGVPRAEIVAVWHDGEVYLVGDHPDLIDLSVLSDTTRASPVSSTQR